MKTYFVLSMTASLIFCSLFFGTATALVPFRGATIAGDYPDPSVIKVGEEYYATATSSSWAPEYPILKSKDLVNWKVIGAVFNKRPSWTSGRFWAPEIAQIGDKFFIYYSAQKKKGSMCVAVASSATAVGPYQDHGPLVCQAAGSIDAAPVVAEDGSRYLFWKEDGNSQKKPTPIWIQRLSEDGLKLVGEKKEVLRNTEAWEGELVEGPFILKRNEYWYMFFSGNACCTRNCNYAMGVARAKNLLGPWEKYEKNPILKQNESWKCPGHGSVVRAGDRDVMLYHAYHAKDSVYVGRQALVDVIEWGKDGWPSINQGKGPGHHVNGFLGAKLRNEEHFYQDEFSGPQLDPAWQWPGSNPPVAKIVSVGNQKRLLLKPSSKTKTTDPQAGLIARSTTLGDYHAIAVIDTTKQKKGVLAGIAAAGEENYTLGAYYSDNKIQIWRREKGLLQILATESVLKEPFIHLRMEAKDGHLFKFAFSVNGKDWAPIGPQMDAYPFPAWDLGIRVALTVGGKGNGAHFRSFSVGPSVSDSAAVKTAAQ